MIITLILALSNHPKPWHAKNKHSDLCSNNIATPWQLATTLWHCGGEHIFHILSTNYLPFITCVIYMSITSSYTR